jgi:hypothetical protein
MLITALKVLRSHCNFRIVVLDDSFEMSKKIEFEINDLDVELHRVHPPDIGLSAGRNMLLEKVESDRFLLMDSDFVLKDPDGIKKLSKVMDETDADIVGGLLWDFKIGQPRNFCGFFEFDNNEIVLKFYDLEKIPISFIDGIKYYECRFCQNFFLGNTKSFRKNGIKWNEKFKVMEHEDFFIRLPYYFKIVETPDVHVIHYPSVEYSSWRGNDCMGYKAYDEEYAKFRHNPSNKKKVKDYYGLKNNFFRYDRDVYFDWQNFDFPIVRQMLMY